mgnify:CR=1 FL=1
MILIEQRIVEILHAHWLLDKIPQRKFWAKGVNLIRLRMHGRRVPISPKLSWNPWVYPEIWERPIMFFFYFLFAVERGWCLYGFVLVLPCFMIWQRHFVQKFCFDHLFFLSFSFSKILSPLSDASGLVYKKVDWVAVNFGFCYCANWWINSILINAPDLFDKRPLRKLELKKTIWKILYACQGRKENFEKFRYACIAPFLFFYPFPCMNSSSIWNWCERESLCELYFSFGNGQSWIFLVREESWNGSWHLDRLEKMISCLIL